MSTDCFCVGVSSDVGASQSGSETGIVDRSCDGDF